MYMLVQCMQPDGSWTTLSSVKTDGGDASKLKAMAEAEALKVRWQSQEVYANVRMRIVPGLIGKGGPFVLLPR